MTEFARAMIPAEISQARSSQLPNQQRREPGACRSIHDQTFQVQHLKFFLPDFTANKRYTLNQGRKWKDYYHFPAPMVPKELSNAEADYWVGDVVYCRSTRQYQIIDTSFTMEQSVFATCYPVTLDDNNRLLLLAYHKSERTFVQHDSAVYVDSRTGGEIRYLLVRRPLAKSNGHQETASLISI
ncbi:hypothetical protein BDB00DRAFT_570545 [Zychaea mexicana]|uniref:uncharacterized protein n=1 Tax=Zychaea mexicana TaxID=64656 RepID=UPI0022FF2E46|nr:uncharacterized protein BDB00DRAFT_570545 [Zychaea mexicana]KAI9490112.1 hypothetical protein BDB00DRAFT_570545 [Zychaea mexicana]